MEKIITKRGKEVLINTLEEWYLWAYSKGFGGMVALEQAMFQSQGYKVCIHCLSPKDLILQDKRALIKSTDYYLCQECLKLWG